MNDVGIVSRVCGAAQAANLALLLAIFAASGSVCWQFLSGALLAFGVRVGMRARERRADGR